MSQKVKWAILGAGKIARSFISDFSAVNNATLVAVAASDTRRAADFATEHNIPLAYSYNELYTSDQVDAVYIATTHNFHYNQGMQCLLHGKHVMCEKPITLNDRQFKQMLKVANEQNVFLMEAMWTWFLPPIIKAMQWYTEGRIGALKVIEASFGFPMEKNLNGRMYNIELAGGALLDLGVYPVAFATYFMQKMPNAIISSGVQTQTGVDERTGMILQYGEVTANLFTSMVNIMDNKAMLYGEKGYIEIPHFFKATTAIRYDDFHNIVETFEDPRTTKGYNYEIQHATDKILQGSLESDVVTHALSNQVQEIMTEVRRQIGLVYPGE